MSATHIATITFSAEQIAAFLLETTATAEGLTAFCDALRAGAVEGAQKTALRDLATRINDTVMPPADRIPRVGHNNQ